MSEGQTYGYDASEFEWENVHEEAADQLVFDTEGDTYIGEYQGHEIIHDTNKTPPMDWFVKLMWRDPEGLKFTNAGYELQTAYVKVTTDDAGNPVNSEDIIPPGTITRNVLVKKVNVKKASPMKSFRVDTAKSRRGNTQG